jgi:hypothetical protein
MGILIGQRVGRHRSLSIGRRGSLRQALASTTCGAAALRTAREDICALGYCPGACMRDEGRRNSLPVGSPATSRKQTDWRSSLHARGCNLDGATTPALTERIVDRVGSDEVGCDEGAANVTAAGMWRNVSNELDRSHLVIFLATEGTVSQRSETTAHQRAIFGAVKLAGARQQARPTTTRGVIHPGESRSTFVARNVSGRRRVR